MRVRSGWNLVLQLLTDFLIEAHVKSFAILGCHWSIEWAVLKLLLLFLIWVTVPSLVHVEMYSGLMRAVNCILVLSLHIHRWSIYRILHLSNSSHFGLSRFIRHNFTVFTSADQEIRVFWPLRRDWELPWPELGSVYSIYSLRCVRQLLWKLFLKWGWTLERFALLFELIHNNLLLSVGWGTGWSRRVSNTKSLVIGRLDRAIRVVQGIKSFLSLWSNDFALPLLRSCNGSLHIRINLFPIHM